MRNSRLSLFRGKRGVADVAGPQAATDGSLDCHIRNFSAMLHAGRTQAACLVKRGLSGAMPATVQKDWSRGCPRAQLSYLVFACWRLLPPAQRKKKPLPMWQSRFRPNLPTQANTSDLKRRAAGGNLGRHASLADHRKGPSKAKNKIGSVVFSAKTTPKNPRSIRHGRLSACLDLMLKTGAVPHIQDRSLC